MFMDNFKFFFRCWTNFMIELHWNYNKIRKNYLEFRNHDIKKIKLSFTKSPTLDLCKDKKWLLWFKIISFILWNQGQILAIALKKNIEISVIIDDYIDTIKVISSIKDLPIIEILINIKSDRICIQYFYLKYFLAFLSNILQPKEKTDKILLINIYYKLNVQK